jgi:hypothetical protein
MQLTPRSSARAITSVLLLVSCGYAAILFFQTRADVYYLSDGGLKYLMVRQFSAGDLSVHLTDRKPPWVQAAWNDGLYPSEPPFVAAKAGRRLIGYPFLFPLLSAPFYLLFGFRGLYVLPTLALMIAWWRFVRLLEGMRFPPSTIALCSLCFMLGSPMVLFGAMFWEHTLAVACVLVGLEVALLGLPVASKAAAAALGVGFGLSVWFRPEAFIAALPILAVLGLRLVGDRARPAPLLAFVAGASASILLFIVSNLLLYGLPFGVHGQHLPTGVSVYQKLYFAGLLARHIAVWTWRSFPIAFLILAVSPLVLVARRREPSVVLLTVYVWMFFAAMPFFLPGPGGKMWGPRWLYVIFPALVVLGAYQLEAVRAIGRRVRPAYRLLFAGLLAYGIAWNSIWGGLSLVDDYSNRVRPALERLRQTKPEAVAVTHQVIGQELAALYHDTNFFLVKDGYHADRLNEALALQDVCAYALLTQGSAPGWAAGAGNGRSATRISAAGRYGSYAFFDVTISDCVAR